MKTYEEWGEEPHRLWCEEMYADWTADRKETRHELFLAQTDRLHQARRAEAAEAERDKAENDAIGYKMDADKLAERVRVLEKRLREVQGLLFRIPKLAQGPSRELWDGIMSDVLKTHRDNIAILRPTEEESDMKQKWFHGKGYAAGYRAALDQKEEDR